MADRVERVERVASPADRERVIEREVPAERASGSTMAARIIGLIAGILLSLLAIRFILAALGANPDNAFANFIYDVTHPFVSPFFSLFGYDFQSGVARFELYTLIAMAVYALIAWALARLLTIGHPESRVRA